MDRRLESHWRLIPVHPVNACAGVAKMWTWLSFLELRDFRKEIRSRFIRNLRAPLKWIRIFHPSPSDNGREAEG